MDDIAFLPAHDLWFHILVEEEVRQRYLQRHRHTLQGLERWFRLIVLKLADEAAGDVHACGQLAGGQSMLAPQLLDAFSEVHRLSCAIPAITRPSSGAPQSGQ